MSDANTGCGFACGNDDVANFATLFLNLNIAVVTCRLQPETLTYYGRLIAFDRAGVRFTLARRYDSFTLNLFSS